MTALMNAYSNIMATLQSNNGTMDADGYWCSNVSGSRNFINYYDLNVGGLATIAPAQQSTVYNAVRAIMQF